MKLREEKKMSNHESSEVQRTRTLSHIVKVKLDERGMFRIGCVFVASGLVSWIVPGPLDSLLFPALATYMVLQANPPLAVLDYAYDMLDQGPVKSISNMAWAYIKRRVTHPFSIGESLEESPIVSEKPPTPNSWWRLKELSGVEDEEEEDAEKEDAEKEDAEKEESEEEEEEEEGGELEAGVSNSEE